MADIALKTHFKSFQNLWGSTLIELLLVVGIVTILSLAILPSYVDYTQRKEFDNKVETFIAEIQNVRNKSLAGVVIPDLDNAPADWGIKPTCGLNTYDLGYSDSLVAGDAFTSVVTETLPAGVTFDPTRCSTIVFERLKGTPRASATQNIIVLNYKTYTRSITVNSSGRITYTE